MRDFDVVVVGGGINGLTTAAYLARAGLSVGVFEARGQCGANCDTVELGIPGFLHNTHATWLVPAMSPVMADLELASYGLDLRGTDVLFAKTNLSGRNFVHGLDGSVTAASIARVSERDAGTYAAIGEHMIENGEETLYLTRKGLYGQPTPDILDRRAALDDALCRRLGLAMTGDDVQRMSGFEVLEALYESEEVRTAPAALGEYTGQWPLHRTTGPMALSLGGFGPVAVHTARGGSHALTHALVKAVAAYGGEVWSTCPVEKIIVRDGRACGIKLSGDALLPGEEISARVVVSNLTLAPTFVDLLGEEAVGAEWIRRAKRFSYDDPQLFAVYCALRDDVEFASASYDPAVQRSWVGYFGGETLDSMRGTLANVASGVVPEELGGGWFIPTRADPTQAPPGCHTIYLWVSVPSCPRRWQGRALDGWDAWPELNEPLADAVLESFERFAPGFGDLVIERHVMSPRDQELNNAAVPRANMCGGAPIPEQMGENRPLPGFIERGVSRTFIPGLHLSNSIHPYSATHLACGYLAACEVAEDLGRRDVPWWRAEALDWYLENLGNIPLNLGVSPKWLDGGA